MRASTLAAILFNGSTPSISYNSILEREIQKLTERGLRVQLLGEVVEATDPASGQKWRFSTKMLAPRQPAYTGLPTLTIDLRTLDTNQYNWKYHYENSLPISSEWGFPLQVKDIDQNGNAEVYGVYQTQTDYFTRAYELDNVGNWINRFSYPIDTGIPDKTGDIDGNGLQEVFFRYRDSLSVFEQNSLNDLPTSEKFRFRQWFYGATGIPNESYDINDDSIKELLFQGSEPDSLHPPFGEVRKTYISKYDSTINGLARIWSTQFPFGCAEEACASAVACGDFDGDKHQEFVTSARDGGVFVVEHVSEGSFAVVWTDSIPVGSRVAAGDVDANGMTEFFAGSSQLESDGYVHLRIYAYERTGNNTYQPVFEFNVFPVGLFFVDLYQTADADGDAVPELILSIGGGPVIFKGKAPHNYELFYYKSYGYLDAVSIAKGGNIQVPHLFVSKHLGGQPIVKMTEVYSLDSALTVGVASGVNYEPFASVLNFPNPFNGETTIRYTLEKREFVSLTIVDINGKEVERVIGSVQDAGPQVVVWNPNNASKQLATGIYLIRLVAGKRYLTSKMLYIK